MFECNQNPHPPTWLHCSKQLVAMLWYVVDKNTPTTATHVALLTIDKIGESPNHASTINSYMCSHSYRNHTLCSSQTLKTKQVVPPPPPPPRIVVSIGNSSNGLRMSIVVDKTPHLKGPKCTHPTPTNSGLF